MLNQLKSEIKTAEANLASAKARRDLDIGELKLIETQIQNCVVYAKESGQVVYANETNRHGGQEIIIEEGVMVREQQVVIRLPDPKRMQVKASINESKVTSVQAGQHVEITLDAMPDVKLDGVVEKVDEYPAPTAWWGGSVKQYQTYIRILDPDVSLKPGLTAKIMIEVESIANCIQVPVQAIFQHGPKYYYVKRDPKDPQNWVAHEAKIGSSNEKFVVITSGLKPGEEVVHGAFAYREKVTLPKLASDSNANTTKRNRKPKSERQPAVGGQTEAAPDGQSPASESSNTEQKQIKEKDIFKELDKNGDNRVTKDEVPNPMQAMFDRADQNSDGAIDRSEWAKIKAKMSSPGRQTPGGGGQP